METPLAILPLPHRMPDIFPLPGSTFQGNKYAKDPPFGN